MNAPFQHFNKMMEISCYEYLRVTCPCFVTLALQRAVSVYGEYKGTL